MILLLLLLLVPLAVLGWALLVFNRLVRLRNQVRNAWADIDVQLERRHDLVPRLVTTVQGYARHEQATLQAVAELRINAMTLTNPARLGPLELELGQAVGRLLALHEAYPDLKANANFAQLQHDLVDVEDKLQYARRFYNGAVRDLNDAIQRAPDLVIARSLGFHAGEFFQAEAQARPAPVVQLP